MCFDLSFYINGIRTTRPLDNSSQTTRGAIAEYPAHFERQKFLAPAVPFLDKRTKD